MVFICLLCYLFTLCHDKSILLFFAITECKNKLCSEVCGIKKKKNTTHPFNSILITIYFHHCVCPCVYVK